MALGLNIVVGFAGLLDLGYVAFFAIGAYTVGWFASGFFSTSTTSKGIHILVGGLRRRSCPGIHFNFLLILVIAVIFTAIAGMIIGLPTLRLRGDYIAIVTLAFGEIIGRLAVNLDSVEDRRTADHGRPPGHLAGRPDRPAVPRPFTVLEPETLVLVRAVPGRRSCCS